MITTGSFPFAAAQVAGAAAKTADGPTRADKKLQEMRDAVRTLQTLPNDAKAARKAMAQKKLEALKQRLKALMMMSGGDPKAIARQAAQIAREIGQAAKEYAAAGGEAAAAAGAASTPQAQQAPAQPGGGAASADDSEAPTEAAEPSEVAATAKPDSSAAKDDTGRSEPDETAAKVAAKGVGGSEPDPFIAEAKQLAAMAKALLKAAIARARREHADPAELREAEARMSAAEKDIDEAGNDLAGGASALAYSQLGESVGGTPAAAPLISVKA